MIGVAGGVPTVTVTGAGSSKFSSKEPSSVVVSGVPATHPPSIGKYSLYVSVSLLSQVMSVVPSSDSSVVEVEPAGPTAPLSCHCWSLLSVVVVSTLPERLSAGQLDWFSPCVW